MLNTIKSTAKDALIYGFGNIAVKIVGLILIPVYTNPEYFSVEEFGIIGLLDISGIVITTLLALSLPHGFLRWYWDKDYSNNQKGLFFMTIMSQIIVSAAFCILLIPLSGTFSDLLFESSDWSEVITLLILSSATQVINNTVSMLMRLQSRSSLYSITNIVKLVVVLTLTLYFILSENMGIEGIYLAQVIGNVFYFLLLSVYTINNCSIFFDRCILKDMNIYGLPLFLGGIAAVLFNIIDRYALNYMSVLKSVALYTLAIKISSVIRMVLVDSVKLAILPTFLKKMDSPDNKKLYSKVLLYTSYVIMFFIVALSLFSLEITKVISKSKEFWEAVIIIPVLSLSVFFINMKEISIYVLYIAKKSSTIGIIIIASTALNILLNIILVPVWDITGAAVATFISQLFYWGASYRYAQKTFFIPYETKKLIALFICGALFSFSGLLLNQSGLIVRLPVKLFLVIIFPFVLYFLRFYETIEIQAIKGFITKWSDIRRLKRNLMSLKEIDNDD